MNMSPTINELITALAKAQGKIQPAIKNKRNPHFKSSYADLSSVWDACRTALSENGLAVLQTIEMREREPILITTLAHSSGQWMRSEMPIITNKMDPQGIGSALTYYRRYCLDSIIGIASEEDDDAERAQPKNVRTERESPQPVEVKPQTITKSQASDLYEKLLWCPSDYQKTINEFCVKAKAQINFEGLPVSYLQRLTLSINQKLAESKAALHQDEQAVEA